MRPVALLACFLLSAAPAAAQYGTGLPGIAVNGTADMTKTPEVLRLYFKQYARGADHDAAKSALVNVEKKFLTKLGEVGVEVIHSAPGAAYPSQNLQSRYSNFQNMMMNRRQMQGFNNVNNGNNNPGDNKPSIFLERFVSVDLRPRDKQKDLLALTGDLQERLRKDYQDLSGLTDAFPKDDGNDDGQPNNMAMRQQMQMYRNDMSSFQNDVRLYLAAKITREDRIKLYGTAMKKARAVAEDLAAAAGVKLGDLQTISSSFMTSSQYGNVIMSGGYVSSDTPRFPFFKDDPAIEAVAVRQIQQNYGQPQQGTIEPLTYAITLNVSFKIEGK